MYGNCSLYWIAGGLRPPAPSAEAVPDMLDWPCREAFRRGDSHGSRTRQAR